MQGCLALYNILVASQCCLLLCQLACCIVHTM
jgi:hypothetical protein